MSTNIIWIYIKSIIKLIIPIKWHFNSISLLFTFSINPLNLFLIELLIILNILSSIFPRYKLFSFLSKI